MSKNNIVWLPNVSMQDVNEVGGKNASLGELIHNLKQAGVKVPTGFATTTTAFEHFLEQNNLTQLIANDMKHLDAGNLQELAQVGKKIRQLIIEATLDPIFEQEITSHYNQLGRGKPVPVAVRSSATAEDQPDASFAGQQETFLNVRGVNNVLKKVKEVFASLYNDRAITYRLHQKVAQIEPTMSVGIQTMINSSNGASGVMFTIDTETGFENVVLITASYGLGETIVQGEVDPDEYYCYKPNLNSAARSVIRKILGAKQKKMIYASSSGVKTLPVSQLQSQKYCLSEVDIETLAKQAVLIEKHYKKAMDIEWAKDGETGEIFILQARPETVKSRQNKTTLERFKISTCNKELLIEGRSIGERIGSGIVKVLNSASEMEKLEDGDVLVAPMTDPDWEPIMKKASAIITNRGGRTCHAAIVARELNIPAIVGTGKATKVLQSEQAVTVSCAEGETGFVYRGFQDFEVIRENLIKMPEIPVKIMLNIGNPEAAFSFAHLPQNGVGLARLEFIINRMIGIHPNAIIDFETLENSTLKNKIEKIISPYSNPRNFYVEKLVEGIATITATFAPQKVILRLSDFKSNEYTNMLGGEIYEKSEDNPMLGFRGASRYLHKSFQKCFEMECEAINIVRRDFGFSNLEIMIPFVRTVEEGKAILKLLAENNLKRGEAGLKIIMMCEIPSNAILADEFLHNFDGFSIGSNDLTQLTLGLDRNSELVANIFDERNCAVKILLSKVIKICNKNNKYIGICGQAPSDYPDFATWLISEGIDSISLNPDTVYKTWLHIAKSTN